MRAGPRPTQSHTALQFVAGGDLAAHTGCALDADSFAGTEKRALVDDATWFDMAVRTRVHMYQGESGQDQVQPRDGQTDANSSESTITASGARENRQASKPGTGDEVISYNVGIRHGLNVQSHLQCTVRGGATASEVHARPSASLVVEPTAQRPDLPEGGSTDTAPSQAQLEEVLDRIEGVLRGTGNACGLDDPEATPIPEFQA